MKFLKLTRDEHDTVIYVNPNMITTIVECSIGSKLEFNDTTTQLLVKEHPKDIVAELIGFPQTNLR